MCPDQTSGRRQAPNSSVGPSWLLQRGRYREHMTPAPQGPPTAAAECCDPVGPSGAVEQLDEEHLAAASKALGHPLRVRILRLLLDRQACVTGDLVAELPVAQSTVSEHLRILREAGLVQGEIEGPRTSYCVNADGLAALKRAVAAL